jgi:hypothetical protein
LIVIKYDVDESHSDYDEITNRIKHVLNNFQAHNAMLTREHREIVRELMKELEETPEQANFLEEIRRLFIELEETIKSLSG